MSLEPRGHRVCSGNFSGNFYSSGCVVAMTENTHTHTLPHLCLCASYINLSFAVSTGVIYTAAVLDCEIKDSYWLTVHATDTGVPPRSASIQVFIQVCYYIFIWLMLHLSWHFVLSALFWLNVFFF